MIVIEAIPNCFKGTLKRPILLLNLATAIKTQIQEMAKTMDKMGTPYIPFFML